VVVKRRKKKKVKEKKPRPPRRCKFPQNCRIKKRSEFLVIQKQCAKYHSRHFVITYRRVVRDDLKNASPRLGITITKKNDKRAVCRNRLKRLIREVFRIHRHKLVSTFDLVIIAKGEIESITFAQVENELMFLFERTKMLKRRFCQWINVVVEERNNKESV
jgi:ribonuclease P protein component